MVLVTWAERTEALALFQKASRNLPWSASPISLLRHSNAQAIGISTQPTTRQNPPAIVDTVSPRGPAPLLACPLRQLTVQLSSAQSTLPHTPLTSLSPRNSNRHQLHERHTPFGPAQRLNAARFGSKSISSSRRSKQHGENVVDLPCILHCYCLRIVALLSAILSARSAPSSC